MKFRQQIQSEFSLLHPIVSLVYLTGVLTISIITLHPWILFVSLILSFLYEGMLCGYSIWKKNLALQIPILIFTVLIQPLFSHSGHTPLFYFNHNPVTLEAYLYGGVIAVLLFAVIQWGGCIRALLSSDKILYLVGRILPAAGLTFSMVLRYIPLMYRRYHEIHDAQRGLGHSKKSTSILSQFRQFTRELSTLISWSLEATIETSSSMESRGYGLKGRTNYHNYKITSRDLVWVTGQLIVLIVILYLIGSGYLTSFYLPEIHLATQSIQVWECILLYLILTGMPMIYDIRGRIKWNFLNSKM